METVYLGIGSNLGDREANIRKASVELGSFLRDSRRSKLYETLPRYRTNQPNFLNCVITGRTPLSPLELLSEIHRIETLAGRDRQSAGWMGPRPIDVDILLFGNVVLSTEELTIPHPRLIERKFALVPLLELDPLLKAPESGKLYADYLASLEPQGIYSYAGKSV